MPDSEHDFRQLKTMQAAVNSYIARERTVDRLLSDLEGLVGSLERNDPSWDAEVRKELARIEDSYAVALMKEQWALMRMLRAIGKRIGLSPAMPGEHKEARDAVERLKALIDGRLAS